MTRVVLLGGSGYVGQALRAELDARGLDCVCPTRTSLDLLDFGAVVAFLRSVRPELVINAAGFTGKPNVDACETARAETLSGNVLLPVTLAHACEATGTAWGHVSSGCIYSGGRLVLDGASTAHKDLLVREVGDLLASGRAVLAGYPEDDPPNFSFRDPPCSFYSGTKALAEEALGCAQKLYLWRLRIPFDHRNNPRNYLTKIQTYPKAYHNYNSLSHLGHFVRACLDLWRTGAPFGVYNMTNPGFVTTREVVALIQKHVTPRREFVFWESDEEFYRSGVKTPRSNCILDSSKAVRAGARLPEVHEALEEALRAWEA